jgi:hypothetical protein
MLMILIYLDILMIRFLILYTMDYVGIEVDFWILMEINKLVFVMESIKSLFVLNFV